MFVGLGFFWLICFGEMPGFNDILFCALVKFTLKS